MHYGESFVALITNIFSKVNFIFSMHLVINIVTHALAAHELTSEGEI